MELRRQAWWRESPHSTLRSDWDDRACPADPIRGHAGLSTGRRTEHRFALEPQVAVVDPHRMSPGIVPYKHEAKPHNP